MSFRLRYPCLLLDHDDTTVDSTALIHHPSFQLSMAKLRPGVSLTLEEYFAANCHPGIFTYFKEVVGLTPQELDQEYQDWLAYSAAHIPTAYPGIRELLEAQRALGGYICVVSHNRREAILRDYEANGLPLPDLIYGCDLPKEQQKPSPYPVEDICRRLGLEPGQLFMVDDLIPGMEMCRKTGVALGAACWAHRTPLVQQYLAEHHIPAFDRVEDLRRYLIVENYV